MKSPNNNEYITRVDVNATFWQYLGGLQEEELIIELIQNDLDAEASMTTIEFHEDRLICHGNGRTVDRKGWERLTYLLGAGYEVDSKQDGIGVKNHGLKTCFRLGDVIIIRSNGLIFKQTLYRNGHEKSPHPGTYKEPLEDPGTHRDGTLIEIPYRSKTLIVSVGESLELHPHDKNSIDRLYANTRNMLAESVIGAIRPGIRRNYTVRLWHYKKGWLDFKFQCGPLLKISGFKKFRRFCRVRDEEGKHAETYAEDCILFSSRMPAELNHRIPKYYRSTGGFFFSEISWPVNEKGQPLEGIGYKRYPLSYREKTSTGRTGLGVSFSGPYFSDSGRHGATGHSGLNDTIDENCSQMLIAVLKRLLVPRFKPTVLKVLTTLEDPTDGVALAGIANQMIDLRSIPLANPSQRDRGFRYFKLKSRGERIKFGPRSNRQGANRKVVIPSLNDGETKFNRLLAFLSPQDEDIVHPDVPSKIL